MRKNEQEIYVHSLVFLVIILMKEGKKYIHSLDLKERTEKHMPISFYFNTNNLISDFLNVIFARFHRM